MLTMQAFFKRPTGGDLTTKPLLRKRVNVKVNAILDTKQVNPLTESYSGRLKVPGKSSYTYDPSGLTPLVPPPRKLYLAAVPSKFVTHFCSWHDLRRFF